MEAEKRKRYVSVNGTTPFDYIMRDSLYYYSASGNDNISTGLVIGSKDPLGGNDGNVGDLQRALNKLGGKPSLTADGKFGAKTKDAVKSLNYSYPVYSTTFYKILSDANKGDASSTTTTLSETDLKALWAKDKTKYGKLSSEPNYDKWIKRHKNLAGVKDFGKGLFTVAMGWLQQKSSGSPTEDDYEQPEPEDTSKIWGMPAAVVYVSGAALTALTIWGVVALIKRKPKVIVQAPAVAAV